MEKKLDHFSQVHYTGDISGRKKGMPKVTRHALTVIVLHFSSLAWLLLPFLNDRSFIQIREEILASLFKGLKKTDLKAE